MGRGAAGQRDRRLIGIICGIEDDNLVARSHDRLDRAEQALRGAVTDGNFRAGINAAAVELLDFGGNRLAQ